MESNENIFVMYQKCNHMKFIGVIYNFAPMDYITIVDILFEKINVSIKIER